MRRPMLWLTLVVAVIPGCKNQPATVQAPPTPKAPTMSAALQGGQVSQAVPPSTAKLSDLPAGLKTDAFEYYGLGYDKPRKLEIVLSGAPRKKTGAQTVSLTSVEKGKALFHIQASDGLAQIPGSSDVSLDSTGVYVEKASLGTIHGHTMELANSLRPGSAWDTNENVETPSQGTFTSKAHYTVVGTQSVTTPAGKFQALLVRSSGTAAGPAGKARIAGKEWFVKGRGAVKTVLTSTGKDGKATTVTIQEVK